MTRTIGSRLVSLAAAVAIAVSLAACADPGAGSGDMADTGSAVAQASPAVRTLVPAL